jgi:hypothetical protein
MKKRLGLERVVGILALAGLDDPDDEIRGGGIDYGLDEGPSLDSLVSSAFTKNYGGFAT